MATQQTTVKKSDVSYTSEEARLQREMDKNFDKQQSDWRKELIEAVKPDDEGNHPYVDVMPFLDQKAQETKRQMKAAAKEKVSESAAMDFMKAKYGKALMSNKPKEPMSREAQKKDANERAVRRAKFAASENKRLYGRKND